MSKFKAWAVRTAWSALAAALGGVVVGPPIVSMAVWKGAAIAAISTVISSTLVFARAQADRLPEVVK